MSEEKVIDLSPPRKFLKKYGRKILDEGDISKKSLIF